MKAEKVITKREYIENLYNNFCKEILPYLDMHKIIDEETELSDIVFFINLTFSNPNNLKETLKDIIDIHNIEVNEFEKAFEIFENFIKIFREIK